MRRLSIFTLVLALLLFLTACGSPADVAQSSSVTEAASPVGSKETEVPQNSNSTKTTEPEENNSFVGLWHSMNAVAAGYGERYAFNTDGTFIYGTSQMDVFERLLFASGTWSVADGKLKLEVEAQLVVPVGKIEDITPSENLIILGQGVVKVIHNPPEIETYSIAKTDTDPETGRETISIEGVTFYDFNNQIDLFDDYYDLNNSGGSDPQDDN